MLNHIIDYNPYAIVLNNFFGNFSGVGKLITKIREIIFPNNLDLAKKFFFIAGLLAITCKISHSVYSILKNFTWFPAHIQAQKQFSVQNFRKRYGKCYVLITGAADGIGFAYSRQFARMGFNLIMADIQQQKLLFKKKELLSVFEKIDIQAFVVDMSEEEKINEFIHKIDSFDIGIVVNNVGLTGGGLYFQINPTLLLKTLRVNFLPAYLINKALIPRLRQRENKSAIINMTSATGYYLSHFIGAYSSVKHGYDLYSRTLSIQNKDKIDIISVRPFGVSTGMMKMRKEDKIISPKECAVSVLKQLGRSDTTFSGYPHKLMASYFESISQDQRFKVYQNAWDKNRNKK